MQRNTSDSDPPMERVDPTERECAKIFVPLVVSLHGRTSLELPLDAIPKLMCDPFGGTAGTLTLEA
jgi:hypothetical protein